MDHKNKGPTSSARGPGRLLLPSGLVAVAVLLLPPRCSDGAQQHLAGLEEGHQEGLLGLRAATAHHPRGLHINAPAWRTPGAGQSEPATSTQTQ